jgi:hypothetical protein
VNILLNLGIGKRKGLGRIHTAFQQSAGIQLRNNTARRKADYHGRKA